MTQQSLFDEALPTPVARASSRFDGKESREGKHRGMDLAASRRHSMLSIAREGLRKVALGRPDRTASADDAQLYLIEHGYQPDELGNAAGSLFKSGEWQFTGRWTKSSRVSSHSNDLRVWRLK